MASKEELLAKLSECVVEMEDEEVVEVAKEYIEAGYPAFDGIMVLTRPVSFTMQKSIL